MTTFTFPKPGEEWDYDFEAMVKYTGPPYTLEQVEGIELVEQGEHDGAEWIWRVKLKDGTIYKTTAGCDYTGWDCQAGSESVKEPA